MTMKNFTDFYTFAQPATQFILL